MMLQENFINVKMKFIFFKFHALCDHFAFFIFLIYYINTVLTYLVTTH